MSAPLPSTPSSPGVQEGPGEATACRVCHKGETESKKLCHFGATSDRPTALTLHVFCGLTAAILPHVQRPQWEILSEKQVKAKFGRRPGVFRALQRAPKARPVVRTGLDEVSTRTRTTRRTTTETYYLTQDIETFLGDHKIAGLTPHSIAKSTWTPVAASKPRQVTPEAKDPFLAQADQQHSVLEPYTPSSPSNQQYIHMIPPVVTTALAMSSPYDLAMSRLFYVCERQHAVAYRMIRSVPPSRNDRTMRNACGPYHPNELTTDQVDAMRMILITSHRLWYLEHMEQHLFSSLSTAHERQSPSSSNATLAFAQDVVLLWTKRVRPVCHPVRPVNMVLDVLLAFTMTLHQYNVWMYAHKDEWAAGAAMVRDLGWVWKKLLSHSSEELAVDVEFTLPGIMTMLGDFQACVESVKHLHFHFS